MTDDKTWDKDKIKDQYRRHTNGKSFIPSLDSPNFENYRKYITPKKLGIGLVLFLGLFILAGNSEVLLSTVLGEEFAAKNIANSNPVVQEFKEEFETIEETSKVPNSTVQKLKESGQIPQNVGKIYLVDYVNEDGRGLSAYVSLESGEVLDTRRSFSIS